MAKNINHIIHKKSRVAGKAPTVDDIEYGEIGINYHQSGETLYIKNDAGEIIPFRAGGGGSSSLNTPLDTINNTLTANPSSSDEKVIKWNKGTWEYADPATGGEATFKTGEKLGDLYLWESTDPQTWSTYNDDLSIMTVKQFHDKLSAGTGINISVDASTGRHVISATGGGTGVTLNNPLSSINSSFGNANPTAADKVIKWNGTSWVYADYNTGGGGNVQADWSTTASTADSFIKNKPFQTLGSGLTKDNSNNLNVNLIAGTNVSFGYDSSTRAITINSSAGGTGVTLNAPLSSINTMGSNPSAANKVLKWNGSSWVYDDYSTGGGDAEFKSGEKLSDVYYWSGSSHDYSWANDDSTMMSVGKFDSLIDSNSAGSGMSISVNSTTGKRTFDVNLSAGTNVTLGYNSGAIVINATGGGGGNVQSDWNETTSAADDYIKNKPFQALSSGLSTSSNNLYVKLGRGLKYDANSGLTIDYGTGLDITGNTIYATGGGGTGGSAAWSDVSNKPFKEIGTGLTVVNDYLNTNLSGGSHISISNSSGAAGIEVTGTSNWDAAYTWVTGNSSITSSFSSHTGSTNPQHLSGDERTNWEAAYTWVSNHSGDSANAVTGIGSTSGVSVNISSNKLNISALTDTVKINGYSNPTGYSTAIPTTGTINDALSGLSKALGSSITTSYTVSYWIDAVVNNWTTYAYTDSKKFVDKVSGFSGVSASITSAGTNVTGATLNISANTSTMRLTGYEYDRWTGVTSDNKIVPSGGTVNNALAELERGVIEAKEGAVSSLEISGLSGSLSSGTLHLSATTSTVRIHQYSRHSDVPSGCDVVPTSGKLNEALKNLELACYHNSFILGTETPTASSYPGVFGQRYINTTSGKQYIYTKGGYWFPLISSAGDIGTSSSGVPASDFPCGTVILEAGSYLPKMYVASTDDAVNFWVIYEPSSIKN